VGGRLAQSLSFPQSRVVFTQTDLALAEDLGRRAALAVDNARLYREATDVGKTSVRLSSFWVNSSKLRALQRITNLLNQRLTNLPGLQVMVRAVCDGIGAEFAMILLHDPQSNQLELTATAGRKGCC